MFTYNFTDMKDFDQWNELKKRTNRKKNYPFFREREIFYTRIGYNVGYEQDGKGPCGLRPVIVYKKFNKQIFWGIPLSRVAKRGKFYFAFTFMQHEKSTAIISQLRLLDAKRLERKIGDISKTDYQQLQKTISQLMLNSDSFFCSERDKSLS